MLDIVQFRESPDPIRDSEKKRFKDPEVVDRVITFDLEWRETLKKVEEMRKKRNENARAISDIAKAKKKPPADLIALNKQLKSSISEAETEVKRLLDSRNAEMHKVGNILHAEVPICEDEKDAVVLRTHGTPREFSFEPKRHGEIAEIVGGVDVHRAAKVTGARFFFLIGDMALLNLALIQYAMDHLVKQNYKPVWTPYLLNGEHMAGAAELADFEETLYKIEGRDLYLIATSEQPIVSMHSGEVIPEEELPLRYAGFSTNFRREAHREDQFAKGIFRIHQFEKVEQLVFTTPEKSWEEHEQMIKNAEGIFAGLDLPTRVVDIASGDLNDAAARKFDLEVWFPTQDRYRELVSCSNCTDFQARRLNIRMGKYGGDKEFLHTLNSTALATERTICAIMENNQLEDGSFEIPKAVRPFMGGREIIRPAALPPGH